MENTASTICKYGNEPDLPIFGLDEDNRLAVIYGAEERLPKTVAATTPGQMHFVVCIDEIISKTIEHVNFYGFHMYRIRDSWKVSLRSAETGELVEDKIIEGQDPAPLPTAANEIVAGGRLQRYIGVPDIDDLANWLLPYLK
jgi:hypothetical protein